MKKILITGGTGFVGRHLLTALQKKEKAAQLHLTSLRAQEIEGATVHALDLTNKVEVEKLIKDLQPEEIYHLASIANVAESFRQPYQVLDNNIRLTLNLLEALRQFSPTSRLLLVSSADIYQVATKEEKISEKQDLNPQSPYAVSKTAQDLMAQTYYQSFSLPLVIARPFNHIGPGQGRGFVIADFASEIARVEKDEQINEIKVGNLTAARDFTDVRDIVQAYILLMEKGALGEAYNLGRGETIKIATVLEKLLALSTKKITVVTDPEKIRPLDKPFICADNSKVSALGWQPQIPIEETLSQVLAYWREEMV